MTENDYDPVGGHTKEEADAAYAELFRELHGEEEDGSSAGASAGTPAGGQGHSCERAVVIGHRKPDADSVCAAIAYARLKNGIEPGFEYIPYSAGDIDAEIIKILDRFGAQKPRVFGEDAYGCKAILVDHNETAQIAEGIGAEDIVGIVDHHRLARAETAAPVWIRCQPYGATCTIIYELFCESGVVPDAQTAGLLCAAIISDTRMFGADTTTRADRLACAACANIAGLDIEAFADAMFSFG